LLDLNILRDRGARTLSELNLNYRSSRLSKTKFAAGKLRAGDRVPDITVACDAPTSAAVPIYTILDPSRFTLLDTAHTPAGVSDSGWPSFVRVVRVRAAEDTQNKQAFVESFGSEGGIFGVRPDAYLGFTGHIDDEAQLRKWFDEHFHI